MTANLYYLCVCVFLLLLGNIVVEVKCDKYEKKHVALFVFGDSIFDPGNNNYINTINRANFPPYGETYFKYPTGRWCDGRTVPDFIAEYAKLPLIPAYFRAEKEGIINGVNFASGGAGALVQTFPGLVINLKTQLKYFKNVVGKMKGKLGERESKKVISDGVYMFSIGNNDYFSLYSPLPNNSAFINSFTHQQYVNMVVGNLTSVIEEIYKEGGRKFVIFSTIPLGCTPSTRILELQQSNTSGCFNEIQDLAIMHNKALLESLSKLEKTLKGFKYSYFDFFKAMTNIVDNPSTYGFKDGITACCGSGPFRGFPSCGGKRGNLTEFELCKNVGDHLFFDLVHPTEKSNMLFASYLWNGANNLVHPYTVKSLFQ